MLRLSALALTLGLSALFTLPTVSYGQSSATTITFDASTPLHTTNSLYVGFNIDTGSIYNGFDFREPVLINLVKQLSPTVVRIGGTAADYAYYIPDGTNPNGGNGHTIISNSVLDDIMYFTGESNISLLWDFNGLTFRDPNNGGGPWDPNGNASQTLDYLNNKYSTAGLSLLWSIGNEPDLWPIKNVNVTQLGEDTKTLKSLLSNYNLGTDVYGASFAGPNAKNAQEYFIASKGNLQGLTVHDYPLARNCNIPSYLNPSPTLGMGKNLQAISQLKQQYADADVILTLEETAGSYGGGCENITDRYASGFYWLHALNVVAASGFDRIHRQDIAGWSFTGGMSHYQLAGPPGWVSGGNLLTPHPDWYSTILWKQIIGTKVLNTTLNGGNASTFVAHMWCTANQPGTVTLSWLNFGSNDVPLTINGVNTVPRIEYTLTSSPSAYDEFIDRQRTGTWIENMDPPASLQQDTIFLNGGLLTVNSQGILPQYPIPGKTVTDPSQSVAAPPYSYGFITFTGSNNVNACM